LSTAPTVTLTATDINTAGTTPVVLTAAYTDTNAGGITGIADVDTTLMITGKTPDTAPIAKSLKYSINVPTFTGAATATETYMIGAPAGGWTAADNGTYFLQLDGEHVLEGPSMAPVAPATAFQVFYIDIPPAVGSASLAASLSASLPGSVIGGQKSKAAATVVLSNPNATLFSGPVTITLYVSPTGSVSSGTPFASITKSLKLKSGKSAKFKLKIPSFPDVNGTYVLVAGVSAGGSVVSAVGPSTLIAPPTVSLTPPAPIPVPQTVAAGGRVTVEFTLQDTGNVPATGTAPLAISLSTQPDGSNATSIATQRLQARLKPRQSKVYKFKVKLPPSIAAGTYYIAVSLGVQAFGDDNAADGSGVSSLPLTVS